MFASSLVAAEQSPLTPDFPAVMDEQVVERWSFAAPADAWAALHDCSSAVSGGVLRVEAAGDDAYVRVPLKPVAGPLVLRMKLRARAQGPVEIFWASQNHPDMGVNGSVRVAGVNDGEWHECEFTVPTTDEISVLRIDPCTGPGVVEIAEVSAIQRKLHPLQFEKIEATGMKVRGTVLNNASMPVRFALGATNYSVGPGAMTDFEISAPGESAFAEFRLSLVSGMFTPLERTLYLHDPAAKLDSTDFGNSNVLVQIARDHSGARILWKGQLAAIAMPLPAKCDVKVEGDDVIFDAVPGAHETGPRIRVVGTMTQGLLSGVEYLEEGEVSSSTLDLERSEHIRFEPRRSWITMPLAAYVTERSGVAMLWDDMSLQPVFATPNLYDGTGDHLMALKGEKIRFRLHLSDGAVAGVRLDDAIEWAVKKRGLPEPPASPRTADQQRELCLRAFNGPLRTSNGWYHATWPGQPQHFYVDHASAILRLTGAMPEVPRLENTGAHVANPAAWLVSGRASEWLAILKSDAKRTMAEQKADGSFRYDGKYRRGHFEDTASGWCAVNALHLFACAYYTGDKESLEAGLKALEYMKRFETPRGAQVWEIPLHTPDILAAADCCRVYLKGYELTGRAEYLDLARRWAMRGIPFVYQWDYKPVMRYGTIAVLGATDWTGVVWIGLPVQWCGAVYAYALTELSKYDHSMDWNRIARGILNCAEQMQYPDGEFVGTFPDSFNIDDQRRLPAYVNPCVIVALNERLEGRLDSVAVATNTNWRVAAPFPVSIEGDQAVVEAKAGTMYQVLVNGSRVVDVKSLGRDVIKLTP